MQIPVVFSFLFHSPVLFSAIYNKPWECITVKDVVFSIVSTENSGEYPNK